MSTRTPPRTSRAIFVLEVGAYVSQPEEISVQSIAEEIVKLTGSKSEIVFEELPVDDPKVRQPDISKAKLKLGWEPKVSREEGLQKTFKYFKSLNL